MANINVHCGNCNSKDLRVRTSDRVGMRSGWTTVICNNCGARSHVLWEVTKLETATYEERKEFLSANKPLNQIDPNQEDLPIDD